jgi:hypothetical protein
MTESKQLRKTQKLRRANKGSKKEKEMKNGNKNKIRRK